MMQQQPQMIPMAQSLQPTNISTEQIQKYLDENRKLILAIMDNQNLGKLAECAQYQALLQKNLMYLAAIADAQPQTTVTTPLMAASPQVAPHPAMQLGGYFMQHPQTAAIAQQPGHLHQQHQQAIQGQMGMRPGGSTNGGGGGGDAGTNGQGSGATGRGGDGSEHGK